MCCALICGCPDSPRPADDAPEADWLAFAGLREVRHTIIRLITAHLRDDATASWQGRDLDFTGVIFDGGDFTCAVFSGGTVTFGGTVDFGGARFSGGTVNFGSADFSGGTVDLSSPGRWEVAPVGLPFTVPAGLLLPAVAVAVPGPDPGASGAGGVPPEEATGRE
ncbi:hypothetical protein ABZT47_38445 [Sphaerisporangium sp. NPDC005289]|uniref:hypothetical protein n=1 Tax=Sphaerisporangium sp. NPDC005289 TaxID=3155247 RepID=UPI0033B08BFD